MKEKTLVWEIVEETDEYYFVICKDIVAKRAFSSECSNLWIESDIRKWLNDEDEGGFLSQFNNNEKMAIKTVQLKTVLAPAYKNMLNQVISLTIGLVYLERQFKIMIILTPWFRKREYFY